VDHFGDLGQAPVARPELPIGGKGPGDQQDDARPQALATGAEQVFGSCLQDWVTSTDQVAQVAEEGFKIHLHRLKKLCDRCHDPLR
jgi:hypothetical protein